MATKLKDVDAVVIGLGFSGAILSRELTKAGLNVVALERGADRNPAEEFTLTRLRDELRYVIRLELMQDNSIDTISFRNAPDELALPIRRFGAFLPGEGVGGTGIHWGALHWRFLPTDFRIRSVLTERYGAKAIPDTMTIQDWPVSYDEIEQHYDRFEKLCGVSGQAGNLEGKPIAGGNPFEGPRSQHYPNKPIKTAVAPAMFGAAAASLGYHPFPMPTATSSAPYVNPEGITLGRLRILRSLQSHRLRGQRKGLAERQHRAGATYRAEIRAAQRRLCHAAQLRQGGKARHQRVLH